jgi:hypothetical protein
MSGPLGIIRAMRTHATPPGARQTFRVRVRPQGGGWLASCETPTCLARGRSEEEALARIRDEIRYRIEWCPCTGVDEDYVQLEIERGGPARW